MQHIKITERRNNYRYRYLAEIDYGNDDEIGKGIARDISLGGVFIAADRSLPLGTKLLVTLPYAKSNRYVSLHGTVVRNTREGFAISFKRRRRYRQIYRDLDWQV